MRDWGWIFSRSDPVFEECSSEFFFSERCDPVSLLQRNASSVDKFGKPICVSDLPQNVLCRIPGSSMKRKWVVGQVLSTSIEYQDGI